MILVILSLSLWATCLYLVWRNFRLGFNIENNFSPKNALLLAAFTFIASLFYFQPHEDIVAGQDAAAYVNMAASFAKHDALKTVDPLLSQIPLEERHLFFWRQKKSPPSTDICLWIDNLEEASLSPMFFLAYPLLLSLLFNIGVGKAALFVAPLFSLLMGISVASLIQRLYKNTQLTFIFLALFWLSPLFMYHGKAPRAEILAGTLLWIGFNFLHKAYTSTNVAKKSDWFIAGFSFSLACLFHISAAFIFPALGCFLIINFIKYRDLNLLFLTTGLLIGLALLSIQSAYILNPYKIDFILLPLRQSLWLSIPCWIGLLFFLTNKLSPHTYTADSKTTSLLAAAGITLMFILLFIKGGEPINITGLTLTLLDFKALGLYLSAPIFIIGGLGLILLPLLSGKKLSLILFLLFLPLLVTGQFYDFSLTRYLISSTLPLFTLGVISCLALIYKIGRAGKYVCIALCLILISGNLYPRNNAALINEKKGTWNNFQQIAEVVKKENGILLCEYAGFAGPLKYIFGVDCLTMSHQQLNDYKKLRSAWKALMLKNPDRPAFLLTHFQTPVASDFSFKERTSTFFSNEVLIPEYNSPPNRIIEKSFTLNLYEMKLNKEEKFTGNVLEIGEGNMNFSGFSEPKSRLWRSPLNVFYKDQEVSFNLPHKGDLFCLFYSPEQKPEIRFDLNNHRQSLICEDLSGGWWLCKSNATQKGELKINSASNIYFSKLFLAKDARVLTIPPQTKVRKKQNESVRTNATRWTTTKATIEVNIPSGKYVLLASSSDREQPCRSIYKSGKHRTRLVHENNLMRWDLLPTDSSSNLISLSTHPAKKVTKRGYRYPRKLGLLIHQINFVSAEGSPDKPIAVR